FILLIPAPRCRDADTSQCSTSLGVSGVTCDDPAAAVSGSGVRYRSGHRVHDDVSQEEGADMNDIDFAGRTVFMTGGSRGIGLAIAARPAREGANIAFLAKTDTPDPRLPGTVHTAAAEIEESGGTALPIVGDVRDDESVAGAVRSTVERFGGIDIVVNNASAIALAGFGELSPKRYDLMQDIN